MAISSGCRRIRGATAINTSIPGCAENIDVFSFGADGAARRHRIRRRHRIVGPLDCAAMRRRPRGRIHADRDPGRADRHRARRRTRRTRISTATRGAAVERESRAPRGRTRARGAARAMESRDAGRLRGAATRYRFWRRRPAARLAARSSTTTFLRRAPCPRRSVSRRVEYAGAPVAAGRHPAASRKRPQRALCHRRSPRPHGLRCSPPIH